LKDEKAAVAKEAESKEAEKEKKEPEFELLQNPCRVIKPQVN
jgi:hypothetical protein